VRRFAAEGLATFALVFLGTGACVVDAVSGGKLGVVGVGVAFGLAVFGAATLFGPHSGAHMNPAVTLALWRGRSFPSRDVAPYLLVQCLGALAASVCVYLLAGGRGGDLGATHAVIGVWPTFALEWALTFVLVLVVLRAPSRWGAAAAGLVVGLEAIVAGHATGASMNPARSLAPALVSGHLDGMWVYLLAPVAGALSAAAADAACASSGAC
jgi:aquaporin Z